jgi:hypothetical protein
MRPVRLCRRRRPPRRRSRPGPRVGGDVDDAPGIACRYAGQHRVVHVQRTGQVARDQLVPLRRLGLGEGLEDIPARVVDQDVDGAQLRLGGRHRGVDTRAIGDVALDGGSLPALGPDGRRHFLGGLHVQLEHGDPSPVTRESSAGVRRWLGASACGRKKCA